MAHGEAPTEFGESRTFGLPDGGICTMLGPSDDSGEFFRTEVRFPGDFAITWTSEWASQDAVDHFRALSFDFKRVIAIGRHNANSGIVSKDVMSVGTFAEQTDQYVDELGLVRFDAPKKTVVWSRKSPYREWGASTVGMLLPRERLELAAPTLEASGSSKVQKTASKILGFLRSQ